MLTSNSIGIFKMLLAVKEGKNSPTSCTRSNIATTKQKKNQKCEKIDYKNKQTSYVVPLVAL